MSKRMTRRALIGTALATTALGCGGFNPFLIPYMWSGGKSKTPAEFELKPVDKNKPAQVVVFVSAAPGLSPDLTGIDNMLNSELITILDARLKENEEKVVILKMQAIDKLKMDDPHWRRLKPHEIGKHFGAHYVIDVEIQQIDLFKEGSRGKFLLGKAYVSVEAFAMAKPTAEAAYKQDFQINWPMNEQPVESPADVSNFRRKFVRRIASDISVKFAASPANQLRTQMD